MEYQQLVVEDFSGGITDNVTAPDPKKAGQLDNLFISDSISLETREGSEILSTTNYQVSTERLTALISYYNHSLLLAQSGQYLYWQNPTWTNLLGPTGNPALFNGSASSVTSYAEWKNQLFITNDSGAKTQKVYKDQNSALQILTAGLPEVEFQTSYSLEMVYALANDLKTAFTAHVNDYGTSAIPSTLLGINLHPALDSASLALISANATDLTTLIALTISLRKAYNSHVADATVDESALYHFVIALNGQNTAARTVNSNYPVNDDLTPLTLADCVTILNELWFKYQLHVMSPQTHFYSDVPGVFSFVSPARPADQYAFVRKHLPTTQPINYQGSDFFTPDYTDMFTFVDKIQIEMNAHFNSAGSTADVTHLHLNIDTASFGYLNPTATLLDFFINSTYLRLMYFTHWADSVFKAFPTLTATVTALSANVTAAKNSNGDLVNYLIQTQLFAKTPGTFMVAYANTKTATAGIFTGDGAFTASIASLTTGAGTAQTLYFTTSTVHTTKETSSLAFPLIDSLGIIKSSMGAQQVAGSPLIYPQTSIVAQMKDLNVQTITAPLKDLSISDWVDIANQTFNAFLAHIQDPLPHYQASFVYDATYPNAPLKPVIATYGYALHYFNEYTDSNGIIFDDAGPTYVSSQVVTTTNYKKGNPYGDTGKHSNFDRPVTINLLKPLVNGFMDNYNLSTLKVKIFRTTDGGTTFFLLDKVANGTLTYTDNRTDTEINGGEKIYTTGGVLDHDPPPICKYFHIVGKFGYYANILEKSSLGGQRIANRVLQSLEDDIDSVPGASFEDVEEDITGISSAKSNPLLFTFRSVYRLEGNFNELGNGFITHQRISDNIGCIGQNSIVRIQDGVFFAGNDGFYFTNGYEVQKISVDFNKRFAQMTQTDTQKRQVKGEYNPLTQQVWWTMQSEPNLAECDSIFVFHLRFGIKPDGAFSTASNDNNYSPSTLCFHNGSMYRGDSRGYIFRHDRSLLTDPRVDTTVAATSWGVATIRYNYVSTDYDFGNTLVRKFVPRMNFLGPNRTNASIQLIGKNDKNTEHYLKPIMFRGNCVWGNSTFAWGDPTFEWGALGTIDEWRRFPAGTLRCDVLSIKITNAYVPISKSDDVALCTRSATSAGKFTVTLASGIWPSQPHDYDMYFVDDNYTQSYSVVSRTSDTIIVCSDPGATNTSGAAKKWIMKGYPKGERLDMNKYIIQYAPFGRTQKAYTGASSEGLSGNS